MTADDYVIQRIDAVDCAFEPRSWPFAEDRAEAIEAHWLRLTAERPKLFNGRVLVLTSGGVERDGAGRTLFRGSYGAVDYKAFLAWRDFGHPVRDIRNVFAMAALRGSDGGFVLGEMADHTANPGRIYFPSGTPDLDDIVDGKVDLEGSARRELAEETGLDLATLDVAPGFVLISHPLRICCMKEAAVREPAADLAARIDADLAREELPELTRMHVVRREADFTPAMPPFVTAYMRWVFAAECQ